jgi:hypothetical protein
MQTGGESIEYLLVNMVFGGKKRKLKIGEDPKDRSFHVSFIGNGLNRFKFRTVQVTTTPYET